jgi:hypothetical protein
MEKARSNFKVVMIVLLVAVVTCLVLSKYTQGTTAGIFKMVGLAFLVAAILQLVVFSISPALYKDKRKGNEHP